MLFHHIGIRISNMEKSLAFYVDTLGFSITRKEETPNLTVIFLDAFGTTLELIYKPDYEPRPMGPVEHIAFVVDDIDEEIQKYKRLGIVFEEKKFFGTKPIVFFYGPDKERFEFMQK